MADKEVKQNPEEAEKNIDSILIVKESGEEKEYSISDSRLTFDVVITEDGDLDIEKGTISTPYFIQNSELDYVRTWRYTVLGVEIEKFHVDAEKNMITYDFLAREFVDMTAGDDVDDEG